MSAATATGEPSERVLRAAIELLAEQGPSAIKARTVASASGMSTMAVYHHFGGIPELLRAVVDHGHLELDRAFSELPVTEDPIADLFTMALTTRRIAHQNPHLYDLMFGLSTRASYRPAADVRPSGRSPAFLAAYQHLIDGCDRLVASGRVASADPAVVAASLWSFVHGYITLELAQLFDEFHDPARDVLLPMSVTFSIGLGDTSERARASHDDVWRRWTNTPTRKRRKPTATSRR